MMLKRFLVDSCIFFILCSSSALAGGPILVGGPTFGHAGQPFTWDPARMPIQYRVDPGPLAVNPSGQVVIDNAGGLQRIQGILSVWQTVPTASISFSNAGPILPAGGYTGGDLATLSQYNDVIGSCTAGTQSPVIFDANASIMTGLGLSSSVIGFAHHCSLDTANGFIRSAAVVLNGKFQDGVSSGSNFELTANEFDEAFTHEFGHLLGLDHSQINVDVLTDTSFPCDLDKLAGLPLMFPEELCQARKDAGLPVLSTDDVAWISSFYPNAQTASAYGFISGVIYFSDGKSHFQGANVIARAVDDPATSQDESRRIAVSCVSGYLFTGGPGQDITGDNTGGFRDGSRNATLIGYYRIPVRPGTYTVEVEPIDNGFVSGSSVGPIRPVPLNPEYWNQQESAFDYALQRDTITVHAGDDIKGIDIILNGTASRFDQFEDGASLLNWPASPFLHAPSQRGGL